MYSEGVRRVARLLSVRGMPQVEGTLRVEWVLRVEDMPRRQFGVDRSLTARIVLVGH